MEKYELEKLRGLPIEGVAERLGLRVGHYKCLCPFHDDRHPSMAFNIRKNTCRCFVCMNDSIGPIDLVMNFLHLDFLRACQWLADENNIILQEYKPETLKPSETQKPFNASRYERFFLHPWLSPEARKFLFDERMIDPRVVSWCRLTSWRDKQGVNWLQIPYYDADGKLIGVQNRNLDYHPPKGGQEGVSRFRFPQGSKCGIYNLPVLKLLKPGEPLFITEGSSDCWSMLSSGHKAIAIPSATLLKTSDLKPLVTLNKELGTDFHMYPDRDVPGERLFLQLKELLPNLVHHQLPPECKDFSEYYLMKKRNRDLL